MIKYFCDKCDQPCKPFNDPTVIGVDTTLKDWKQMQPIAKVTTTINIQLTPKPYTNMDDKGATLCDECFSTTVHDAVLGILEERANPSRRSY